MRSVKRSPEVNIISSPLLSNLSKIYIYALENCELVFQLVLYVVKHFNFMLLEVKQRLYIDRLTMSIDRKTTF